MQYITILCKLVGNVCFTTDNVYVLTYDVSTEPIYGFALLSKDGFCGHKLIRFLNLDNIDCTEPFTTYINKLKKIK